MTLEHAVHRVTGELAEWYGVDAGHLRVGDRADVVVGEEPVAGAGRAASVPGSRRTGRFLRAG